MCARTHNSDIRKWWNSNKSRHFSPWKLSISWALFWGSGTLNSMRAGGGGGRLGWGPKEEGFSKAVRSFKGMFIRLIEHYISLDNLDVSCHSGTKRRFLPLLLISQSVSCFLRGFNEHSVTVQKEPVHNSFPGHTLTLLAWFCLHPKPRLVTYESWRWR